jgi:glycosyltransferase involved in cell wall biosynthesis
MNQETEGGRFQSPVVYFGNDWNADNRTSSHHIARWLARRVPVLYIDSPGFRAPKATSSDLKKIQSKLKAAFEGPRAVEVEGDGPGVWLLVVPQAPFRRLPFVKAINRLVGSFLVRRALRKLHISNYISWFATPDMASLAGTLGEKFIVYYCTDDHASMPGVEAKEISALDALLTRKAGQVFVTSPVMQDDKRKLNQHVQYSPHGVDVSMFERSMDPDLEPAQGSEGLPKPVIGFWGTVDAWVDTDLVRYCAERRPGWTFLLIGKVNEARAELESCSNVVLTGPQPYAMLPHWAKCFDVAVIPFRKSQLVTHINPLKLREYLATGRPVVSTPMPEVEKLRDCVGIGRTREEFLQQLDKAVHEDTEEQREKRLQTVRSMTWEARVSEVTRTVMRRMSAERHG